MESKNNKIIKRAFLASIPVLAGYVFLGIGFGIILESKGYGLIWAVAMSVFIYAGALQYVAINLIDGGATLITTALTTIMVNARHLFYAISMIGKYQGAGKMKPYLIFALTDETYSIVVQEDEEDDNARHKFCFFLSMFNQSYWIIGSALGSILGAQLPVSFEGIDFAMTALFVSAFVEQWLADKQFVSAATGVIVSAICVVIFGPSGFLIPAMIGITLVLTILKKVVPDDRL